MGYYALNYLLVANLFFYDMHLLLKSIRV